MRRLMAGAEGGTYLGGEAPRYQPLARIKSTGARFQMSRSVIWGLAHQKGFDPTRWRLEGAGLVTWAGEQFNMLLAALLTRHAPGRRFLASPERIAGPVTAVDLSLDAIRDSARQAEQAGDLPLSVAAKFAGPSRFFGELSSGLSAGEKRRSVPWAPFQRWLDPVTGTDIADRYRQRGPTRLTRILRGWSSV